MAKWTLVHGPEFVPEPIDAARYRQLIAEIGELLYDYFCQLDQKKKCTQGSSIGSGSSRTANRVTAKKRPEGPHE